MLFRSIPRRVHRSEPLPEGIQVLEARSLREALNMAILSDKGAHTNEPSA